MPYKFIDDFDMNVSNYVIKVLPGMYHKLQFRFAGTQETGQSVTQSDFGDILLTYNGKQRRLDKFSELDDYNSKHGGALEAVNGGAGTAFSYNFFVNFAHPDDDENVLFVPDDKICRIEWRPDSGLAAKVVAASRVRVTGKPKLGRMKYIWGSNRTDIALVSGRTRPEQLRPYNVALVFIEYNTNIDQIDLSVDGRNYVQGAEIVEVIGDDLHENRIETYSASGFAEINLVNSKTIQESLNSQVDLTLTGSASDTISVFWYYFDYQTQGLAQSDLVVKQEVARIDEVKAATGGQGALAVKAMLL